MARQRMVRVAVLNLLIVAVAASARAQSLEPAELAATTTTASTTAVVWSAPAGAAPSWPTRSAPGATGWSAPPLRFSLATAFVGLQTLDVVTTLHGVRSGSAVEANPLVGNLADHPAALIAVKGALTAATVASIHTLSKKHPKGAALAMIVLNAGSAYVVRSNLRLTVTR